MSHKPLVTAICLTAGRQQFTERALKCFFAQTYERKRILVLDNGKVPFVLPQMTRDEMSLVTFHHVERKATDTIGSLRNLAAHLTPEAEPGHMLCHWDSDDYSAPNRIALQVQDVLEHPDCQVCGWRSMLFWDSVAKEAWSFTHQNADYCIGTSMMYRISTVRQKPFPPINAGEDTRWSRELRKYARQVPVFDFTPSIVATIHDANHGTRTDTRAKEWARQALWDETLERLMAL